MHFLLKEEIKPLALTALVVLLVPAAVFAVTSIGNDVLTDGDLTVAGNAAFDTDNFYVDSDHRRIGVHTDSPDYTLDVDGQSGGGVRVITDGDFAITLKSLGDPYDFTGIKFTDKDDNSLWTMGNDYNYDGGQNFWLYDNVNGKTPLYMDPAGLSYLSFGTTAGGVQYDDVTQKLQFFTGATVNMTYNGAGYLGIGTQDPLSALHVADGSYAQFEDNNFGPPPGGDCDDDTERGRISIDTNQNHLYICNGASRGWDYVNLID